MHGLNLAFIRNVSYAYSIFTPSPIHRGRGKNRSISIDFFSFLSLFVCLYLCFFVSKITRKPLDRFAWNFQGRCGVTMGRPGYIFGQFRETVRCRDAQHGDGVCCAFAPQIVWKIHTYTLTYSILAYKYRRTYRWKTLMPWRWRWRLSMWLWQTDTCWSAATTTRRRMELLEQTAVLPYWWSWLRLSRISPTQVSAADSAPNRERFYEASSRDVVCHVVQTLLQYCADTFGLHL